MGTGSSCCSPRRRWRRPRSGSGSGSAPARRSPEEERARAAAAAAAGARGSPAPVRVPLSPLGEPDSDSELLDQALAECDPDWLPRAPWHPSCTPGGGEERSQAPWDRQILLTRVNPALENNNFANNLPLKTADGKPMTSYDYSEVEMMAAIEQEYGR